LKFNYFARICGEKVRAYIFRTKYQNHWKHVNKTICDNWYENKSDWHLDWQNEFPEECTEVVLHDEHTGEKHQADVKTYSGKIIEFQKSSIALEEVESREAFYEHPIWVVNAEKKKVQLKDGRELKFGNNYGFAKIQWSGRKIDWCKYVENVYYDFGSSNPVFEKYLLYKLQIDNKSGYKLKHNHFIAFCISKKEFVAVYS